MSALRDVVAYFTTTVDSKPLEEFDDLIDQTQKSLLGLGAVLGAIQFVRFVNGAAGAADDLGDAAERLNISTDALQEWGFAAKLSGSNAEEFQGSISHLVRSLSEAGEGAEGPAAAFRQLGVHVKDARGNLRSVDDLLPDIADGISKIDNPTKRAALAMQVFGRGAIPLVPLLSKGAAGVEKLRQEFRDLGGGLSPEAIEQASKYNDQLDRLDVVVTGLKSRLLNSVLPTFEAVAEGIQKVGQGFDWISSKTYFLESAMVVLGGRMAWLAARFVAANASAAAATIAGWLPVLVPLAAVAAGLTVITVAVDDVVTLFSGGKSAIGDFIDAIFGIGTAEQVILSIKQAFQDTVFWAQKAASYLGLGEGPIDDSPDAARERRRNEAVAAGDVEGFISERASGTREEGLENFKASRSRYLADNPTEATDKDINGGLIDPKVAQAAKSATVELAPKTATASKTGGRPNVNVAGSSVVVNLPPGSDKDQVARFKKAAQEVMEEQHRKALAAVAEVGT